MRSVKNSTRTNIVGLSVFGIQAVAASSVRALATLRR